MMITSFRKSLQRDEAGQAIILGAVMMLLLAVSIMTTVQLGWAIKARIQLQHAADNAAYSNATMVARSMNFIAWTNRAMVSQYVSAMAFQSMITYLDGMNMLVAAAAASALTAGFLFGVAAKICMVLSAVPFIGAAFAALEAIFTPISEALGKAGEALEKGANAFRRLINGLDGIIAGIVKGIGWFNHYVSYWLMQQVLAKGFLQSNYVSTALGGTNFYKDAMTGTASNTVNQSGVYDQVSSLTTALTLGELFDKASTKVGTSGNLPRGVTRDDVNRAETLMTMLINGSRESHKGELTFESKREFSLSAVLQSIMSILGFSGGGTIGKVVEVFDGLFPKTIGGTLIANVAAKNRGESEKIGTSDKAKAKEKKNNPVFYGDEYWSYSHNDLLLGRALISEEYVQPPSGALGGVIAQALNVVSFGGALGELSPQPKRVGIQATNNKNTNFHCHYDKIAPMLPDSGLLGEFADQCDSACDGQGDDCTAVEECLDGLNQATESIGDAMDSASSSFFGGRIAKVVVSCNKESGEARRHTFKGITPYVSFDIKRFDERQRQHVETYPTFLAAANWLPSFMKHGALGFGDNFSASKRFKIATIGKAGGHPSPEKITSRETDDGQLEDLAGNSASKGYNFNFLSGGENDMTFLNVEGFHAWSAAQVYYHRPGTWAEPPNLFNPYWKPKLAPVVSALGNLPDGMAKLVSKFSGVLEQVLVH